MSFRKSLIAGMMVLAITAGTVYGLFILGGGYSGRNRGPLESPSVRSIVTLSIMGGSAFITGFGFRDVVGRIMGARQQAKLAGLRGPKKP